MATQVDPGPEAVSRPTGTVTFLFSDIEGSTQRWENDRESMAIAVARHDALVREQLDLHGAYVFKTMGDAFCTAFARPEDAIAAALATQRALAFEDFSAVDGLLVRMALHTGSASERNGDYFGPAVNRVARLLAIGHGAQVLVSGTATDLLQGAMPPQSSLRDLGTHRLKDLAQPEQVYQLVAADLPQAFPPLRSLDHLPNNLPAQLTSFVGRDTEVTEIKSLLEQHRFVTLVGTGGAGKTRCAVQVGGDLLDGSGDGVWLAELAPVSEPSLVASVILQALNLQGEANRPALETVVAFLRRKRMMLIIDNCEHVLDEARNVVDAILRQCPDVRVLATSREGLNIAGERIYRMPSLPVPTAGEHVNPDEALLYGSIGLFVERATASDGRFVFSAENAPYVSEICRRLDGIPLAIELAAARVKVLAPQQLAKKLDERFRVLTGGNRTALPRQQTMRALVDWSYDLLTEAERTLFRKLAIFAGGFTLELATVVCGDGIVDEIEVLDLLSSLVDKSLVQVEPVANGTRYRLLESMRQYARERLAELGDLPATEEAHARAFLDLAEELDRIYETTPDRAWMLRAEGEMENWRAALEWAIIERQDAPLGQRLVIAMRQMWSYFAPGEGRRWLRAALETVKEDAPDAVVAQLDLTEDTLLGILSLHKAGADAGKRALSRFKKIDDKLGAVKAQVAIGMSLTYGGNEGEAVALLTEVLPEVQRLGLRKTVGRVLRTLGDARGAMGDLDGGRAYYADALRILRTAGAEYLSTAILINHAEVEFRAGNVTEAVRLAEESLNIENTFKYGAGRAITLSNLAAYLLVLGRFDEARARGRETVTACRDAQAETWLLFALQHLTAVATFGPCGDAQDARRRAARILGYVDARLTATEAAREYTEQQEFDRIMPALRDALGADEVANLMREGGSWDEDQAVAEAMLA